MATQSVITELPTERRQELLDAFERILLADGFAGTTLDEFAARLKCSKSTLYRLAPSKDQLVAAVARHFFSHAAIRIEAAVMEARTPPEKLAAYVSGVGREMRRGSPTFHEQMSTQPVTAELYLHNAHVAADRVRSLIREGVEAGFFHVADAEFAGAVVATVLNAIHTGDLMASRNATDDAHSKLSELMLFGLIGHARRRLV
jgi:AcrR family transcriptional regulator